MRQPVVISLCDGSDVRIRAHVMGGMDHADNTQISIMFYQDNEYIGVLRLFRPEFEEMLVTSVPLLQRHTKEIESQNK